MTPTKQTVYIPIKEHSVFKILEAGTTLQNCYPQEGYFFTPEELNEYTQSLIKQALEIAAKNVKTVLIEDECPLTGQEFETREVDKQSITNTFGETFKEFEV
jgi:hypothetical protein